MWSVTIKLNYGISEEVFPTEENVREDLNKFLDEYNIREFVSDTTIEKEQK